MKLFSIILNALFPGMGTLLGWRWLAGIVQASMWIGAAGIIYQSMQSTPANTDFILFAVIMAIGAWVWATTWSVLWFIGFNETDEIQIPKWIELLVSGMIKSILFIITTPFKGAIILMKLSYNFILLLLGIKKLKPTHQLNMVKTSSTLVNFILPGIGTLIAWKPIQAAVQVGLVLVAAFLILNGLDNNIIENKHNAIIGIPLLIVTWFWAMMVSALWFTKEPSQDEITRAKLA